MPSERCILVDGLQTAQQLVIRAAWRGHGLKDRLESPAVQLLVNLVPVEIHGDQAEQVDVHHLAGAHAADHVRQPGLRAGRVKDNIEPFIGKLYN